MIYMENILVCMAAPLLVACFCMGKKHLKFFVFCFAGMGSCLLSAYINSFFAAYYAADLFGVTAEISPVVEEVMKLLPILFYLLIFEPEKEKIQNAVMVEAVSFATFENVCYLMGNGADKMALLMVRGFGTGVMHIICGFLVGYGLMRAWEKSWLRFAGTCGLLGMAITIHSIYNLLVEKILF